MINTVIRDLNGYVINIGEWDYVKSLLIDDFTGEALEVVNNPLPDGSTSSEEDIGQMSDGGFYVISTT